MKGECSSSSCISDRSDVLVWHDLYMHEYCYFGCMIGKSDDKYSFDDWSEGCRLFHVCTSFFCVGSANIFILSYIYALNPGWLKWRILVYIYIYIFSVIGTVV